MSSQAKPDRSRTYRHLAPVAAALALFAAFFVATTIWLLHLTGGELTYALDDAYIHMAIAKNVALHGVWGVQADAFSAASSSPLWTALLAIVFTVVGVRDVVPLLLNVGFAVASIVVLGRLLRHAQISGVPMFAILASVVLAAPLVPMVWIGMEHTLSILLTILVAWAATSSAVAQYSTRRLVAVCGLAALMVATRYEGLFVVAGCAVVFALVRRPAAAVALTAAGVAPVVCIGIWNLSHGWFFLPASILMKQTILSTAGGGTALMSIVSNITLFPPPTAFVVLLATAFVLLVYQGRSGVGAVEPLLIVFATAALLHVALARFGWLFRYESYLMALGTLAVGVSAVHVASPATSVRRMGLSASDLAGLVALVGVLAFSERTVASHALTASVAGHIARQHRQVAEFLNRHYDGEMVAVNDIGVVSYYSRARVFDLMGLASLEVATLRRAGGWDIREINDLLSRRDVYVAIVYDTWFQGDQAFHQSWKRVGEWTTDREEVRSEGTVSFFARDADAAMRLSAALRDFKSRFRANDVETRIF
jgi:hypothetical protein